MIYIKKRIKPNIILECGEELEKIIRMIKVWISEYRKRIMQLSECDDNGND